MGDKLKITVDTKALKNMEEAFKNSPTKLLQNLADAYGAMGKLDIEHMRTTQTKGGRFLRFYNGSSIKGAFRYKSTDKQLATDPTKIFVNEYSKMKFIGIHETGGKIKGRGALWVLQDAARGASNKRRWSDEQIQQKIKAGVFRIAKITGGRLAVIRDRGKHRFETIAIFQRSVTLKKRLDWWGTINSNAGKHINIIQGAIDKTMNEIYGGNNGQAQTRNNC